MQYIFCNKNELVSGIKQNRINVQPTRDVMKIY